MTSITSNSAYRFFLKKKKTVSKNDLGTVWLILKSILEKLDIRSECISELENKHVCVCVGREVCTKFLTKWIEWPHSNIIGKLGTS